ncbi:YcxB family protein [Thermus sediminis]|uniref:YcxB family protein n=1 Tax=Thermus sediminis TaxID=1761908 RepID=UPI000E3D169C|nr:YcxB family protein [Thermus sediminis]
MGKYEEAFSRLAERALARLEGPGGFLAVTETHLVLVDETGVKRMALSRIRRVGRGEGGNLVVQGEEETLTIPLRVFPLEELKAFLEGLRPHVARARKATAAPPPSPQASPLPSPEPASHAPSGEGQRVPIWEEEAPPKPASVELAPEPKAAEAPADTPRPKGGGSPLALPLKALALLTLAYTVAFVALNPGADPWALAGVVLGGLGLALTEWSLATSSR